MAETGENETLLSQLQKSIEGSEAHIDFDSAIKDFPAELRGVRPEGGQHSAWELLEHMRIAQEDILDFSRNPDYKARKWPDSYWPESPKPASDQEWEQTVAAFKSDRAEFEKLLSGKDTDLFKPLEHGDGQTLLREGLLVASHNSYHLGQLVYVKKLLTKAG